MDLTDNEEEFLSAAVEGELDTIKSFISTDKISLKMHDEIRDENGDTALMLASWEGHLEVVCFLLKENSVDVDVKNNYSTTALHYASREGHVEIIKLLVSKGAKVNQQNNYGFTALHYASCWGTVEPLLERGANPHIKDKESKTSLDYAQQRGQTEVANAIEQHIQRLQQIRELIRCNDTLPIAIWPIAISRLESVHFIFPLLSQVPFLFKHVAEEAETCQKPPFSVPHATCPSRHKKRKRQNNGADGKITTKLRPAM